MKKFILLSLLLLTGWQSQAVIIVGDDWSKQFDSKSEIHHLTPGMTDMHLEEFLNLTPKKYRKKTGKRLGLKKALQLKAAQKLVRKKLKTEPEIAKDFYVLLALLALGWLAMGIMDDWSGSNWITNLLFSLCWLPGLIYALVKRKDYY